MVQTNNDIVFFLQIYIKMVFRESCSFVSTNIVHIRLNFMCFVENVVKYYNDNIKWRFRMKFMFKIIIGNLKIKNIHEIFLQEMLQYMHRKYC